MAIHNIAAGQEWLNKLCASIDEDPNVVTRVILDVPYDGLVKVYVEKIGSKKIYDIVLPSREETKIVEKV